MANTATLKSHKPQVLPPAAEVTPGFPCLHPFALRTDPGRVRRVNQDAVAALPKAGIFVVCDGVGGAAAGEVASRLAAETFLNSLVPPTHPRRNPPKASSGTDHAHKNGAPPLPATHPQSRLQHAVHSANHAVFQRAQRSRSMRGMGTTLIGALWDEAPGHAPTLWLAHVGDSRCYLFRRGALELLTRDHSIVEEQVRAGVITRLQAETSPIRNVITRAIGTQPLVEPDIAAHPAQPGDLVLLASDGLTRELSEAHVARILDTIPAHPASTDLELAAEALIDAANAHGGRDNITVLLVACP